MKITYFWELFKMFFKRFRRKKIQIPKPYLVILDPGHGGDKNGAVSRDGTVREKEVVLNVAKMVSDMVKESDLPFKVYLTRQTDIHISLFNRCAYANAMYTGHDLVDAVWNKDKAVFVSIHCNARNPTGKYGLEIETFFHGESLNSKGLAGTMLNSLIHFARTFAMPVFNRGAKIGKTWSNTLRRMVYYYVIKNTVMPATILELGFLTDNEEAKLLDRYSIQLIFAQAIIDGLTKYFEEK